MTSYSHHGNTTAPTLFPAMVHLYATVYAEPPYLEGPDEVNRFRESLPAEVGNAGFSLIAAEEDEQLIGVSYGWTMAAGTWWSRADQQPPSEVRECDKFAVMEWIVQPNRRGEGIGAQLMAKLLSGRPEKYATLASDPRSPARRMYERADWRQVARTTLTWGPEMDLLVKRL